MNTLRRSLLILVALALIAFAPATALGGTSCHTIDAIGVGQDLGGGQTVAQISNGGLLQGTTAASFTITGFVGTIASFEGTITFWTNRGSLTASVAGTLDLATGAFSATTTSLVGTGKLDGATGSLAFDGVENLATGAFSEVVQGSICLDLAP